MPEQPLAIFLSIVVVARGRPDELAAALRRLSATLIERVLDHELIVIDNASTDATLATLRHLTGEQGLPNLQVYALVKEVDEETAAWVGFENALGDYVALVDLRGGDAAVLDVLIGGIGPETDIVFSRLSSGLRRPWPSQLTVAAIALCYRLFTGTRMATNTARHRLLGRRVVNYVQQHPLPVLTFQSLPSTGGFVRTYVECTDDGRRELTCGMAAATDTALRLLVSQTHGPMRFVSGIAVLGAVTNLLYAAYILGIALFKESVQPGWVTLSLQQSGMFLLISVAIGVLGEYTGQLSRATNEGPRYHVAREFTSTHVTRRSRINVDEDHASSTRPSQANAHVRLGA